MTARTLRGDAALAYLEATALLANLGPDPDAAQHWDDLGRAIGSTCRIPHCDTPTRAGGLCDVHYRRHRRTGQTEAHLINRRATHELAADVIDLLDLGERPARIPHRVGASLAGIEKALRRTGHAETARVFETERNRERAAS